MKETILYEFKGVNTSLGKTMTPSNYFLDARNFNQDGIIGANKITYPSVSLDIGGTASVDGIFEFQYQGSSNQPQKEEITVIGGTIYKDWKSSSVTLKTGLQAGKCTFATHENELYIANGKNYVQVYDGTVVRDMATPTASEGAAGTPSGTYSYAITFDAAAGHKYIGGVSNEITVVSEKVILSIPVGYAGTTERKIYRTGGGNAVYKLIATIGDNTTIAYEDNNANGSEGAEISAIENEQPKPYFIDENNERLIGTVSDQYPTQIWITDSDKKVWDNATYTDTSQVIDDPSPIVGMAQDYNRLVIGTEQNLFVLDVSEETPSLFSTRAFVGVKDGHSMARVPANGDFPGGVMFLSSLGDVRVFLSRFKLIETTLNDLSTENFSQVIQPTIDEALVGSSDIGAVFYDYKYHLSIGNLIFVYDIRTSSWMIYDIKTTRYQLNAFTWGLIDGDLYVGQKGDGIIEKMYSDTLYKYEEVTAYLLTPEIRASETLKRFRELTIFYEASASAPLEVTNFKVQIVVTARGQSLIEHELTLSGGAFSNTYFETMDFETDELNEDYRVFPINAIGRQFNVRIESTGKGLKIKGMRVSWHVIKNEEVA
jgi:hypothetical protein